MVHNQVQQACSKWLTAQKLFCFPILLHVVAAVQYRRRGRARSVWLCYLTNHGILPQHCYQQFASCGKCFDDTKCSFKYLEWRLNNHGAKCWWWLQWWLQRWLQWWFGWRWRALHSAAGWNHSRQYCGTYLTGHSGFLWDTLSPSTEET